MKKKGLKKQAKRTKPVWKGPEEEGITQSLLSLFVVCRERFRLRVVEGLAPPDTFNHRIEYGQMWHLCEECAASDIEDWRIRLKQYVQGLCKKYPLAQETIAHWYRVCLTQFPIYLEHWKKHGTKKAKVSLMNEQTFCVPYELPSGRVVKLKGKWDGVILEGAGNRREIWLDEHKTKGDIKEEQMRRQLTFDLQTMIYIIALDAARNQPDEAYVADEWSCPIVGVNYNVVRRPLSGGKGSIRRHKATAKKPEETLDAYYERVRVIIAEEPEHFFMCWKVVITPEDVERFKSEFLNPILEQLCRWWDWEEMNPEDHFSRLRPEHSRLPYGIYNPIAEGRTTEVDEYLMTGSMVGLERNVALFSELK